MTNIVSKPDYGEKIINEDIASDRLQLYFDDIERKFNNPTFPVFTVADLQTTIPPALTPRIPASSRLDGMVIVSNETGGRVPAFSDGTNWRRVTDRAVVS